MSCPCGSGRADLACCGPLLDGSERAATAEALMRSRYTAFVRGAVDYLLETYDPSTRGAGEREAIERWARGATWLGLEVLATERGGDGDSDGLVEFRARYRQEGTVRSHHERSRFRRVAGNWCYVDGEVVRPVKPAPVQRAATVGRNDPCPCKSGRKFKKCCGA